MLQDDFRLYNSFKPIKVDEKNYILFFNGNEKLMEDKLNNYSSFIHLPWKINKRDFSTFIKKNRVYYIEKMN